MNLVNAAHYILTKQEFLSGRIYRFVVVSLPSNPKELALTADRKLTVLVDQIRGWGGLFCESNPEESLVPR